MAYASPITREEAESLRLEDVQKHLTLDGWVRDVGASWKTGAVYRRGDDEVVLPTTRTVVDYAARLTELVGAVAAAANQSPRTVLATLLRPPSTDAIGLREISPLTTQGYIPLREGVRLITGGFDGLLAVAHSACDPLAFHPRVTVREATDLLDQCRLGADRGSFVATILVPVPQQVQLALPSPSDEDPIEDEPFARQVSRLFMSAVGTIRSALDADAPERLLVAASTGVSGNLCEALADMLPTADQGRVEITADWSRTRRRVPPSVPSVVTLRGGEQSVLRSVAKGLKERRDLDVIELAGRIMQLSGDTATLFGDQSEQFHGQVRLRTPAFDQLVQFRLVAADFRSAVEAYRTDSRVRVTGTVRRSGQTVELQNPTGFRVT